MILSRLLGDRRGIATLVTALTLMVMMASAALAVDLGTLYVAKRRLQGVADDAALAAATVPSDPAGAARRTVQANGLDASVAATSGRYSADRATPSSDRFSAGGATPDAVQVTLTQDAPLFFGRTLGRDTVRLTASATAARIDYAALSIGSRLASVSGGMPNAILSALSGTQLALTVADYDALAHADVDLVRFARALGSRAGVTAGGFGNMLAASATLPQAVNAIADALAAAGSDAAAVAALRTVALRVPGTAIRMSDLIDPGILSASDRADAANPIRVDAWSLLRETSVQAGGARQAAIDLPASTGIASARLWLAVGERPARSPWLAIVRDGSVVVRTAQARLYLDAKLPGAAPLGLVSLHLPLYVEVAQAQAKLQAISCASGRANASATLSVQPAIGSAAIAEVGTSGMASFTAPLPERTATIAHALLFDVAGSAHVAVGGVSWQSLVFTRADVTAGVTRTVSTGDAARGTAASLVSGMNLTASAPGVGVTLGGVTAPVGAALGVAAPGVDAILAQALGTMGIGLGQADVRVDGLRCGRPTLVF
ncbi:TadG family pilus assembly protein [Sphingomonas sp.]|uniref:TadG family pilus assembly protein n=1 Tax=Sphingomonas sp. TaxID=28214 RepID=UPI003B000A24